MSKIKIGEFIKEKLKVAMKIRNDALLQRLESWAAEVAGGVVDTFSEMEIKDFRFEALMQRNVEMRDCLEAIQKDIAALFAAGGSIGPSLQTRLLDRIQLALDPGVKGGTS